MKLAGRIRILLIFTGITAGVGAFFVRIVPPPEAEPEGPGQVVEAPSPPVILHTATPPEPRKAPLSKPVSLVSGFGRSELTGETLAHVPASPLDELDIDRRWDVNLALRPPEPPSDLPSAPASDEVMPPDERELPDTPSEYDIAHLSPQARHHAGQALTALQDGMAKLREGTAMARRGGREGRAGQDLIRQAAELLRQARDELYSALRVEPQDPELLRMMTDTKASLYICLKHGNY